MRILILVLVLLSLAALPARAFQFCDWSPADLSSAKTYFTFLGIDYLSTLHFLRNGGEEANPLLGRNPSAAQVTFAAGAAGSIFVAGSCLLPAGEWRTDWHGIWTLAEVFAVINNSLALALSAENGGAAISIPVAIRF